MSQLKKYLNKAQLTCLLVQARIEIIIASRRFGKSHGILSHRVLRNVNAMPGSTGAFVASSFKQAKLRTLPAIIKGLTEIGLKENIHYVIGKRPPKRLGFKEPLVKPLTFDDVISFWNGAQMIVISQEVPMSSNSMTIDWIIGDEAKGLDHDKLKSELFPAMGGILSHFQDCPWYHSMVFVTDMPTSKEGGWLLSYREKMNTEVIDTILQLVAARWELTQKKESEWNTREIKKIDELLFFFRKEAVLYKEFSIFENIDLIGADYVKQQKLILPPLIFQTAILSRRIGSLQGGFYPNFKINIHTYIANNNKLLKGYHHEAKDWGCQLDTDLDTNEPIAIAFDYNANINWLVAGQVSGSRLNVIRSFYVKYQRKLREIVDDFCNYYRFHTNKNVIFYYDSTALGSNYAVNNEDFRCVVVEQFHKNGWGCEQMFIGKPMSHTDKHRILNDCLTGSKHLFPMINKENNEALILSITGADIAITSRGFAKQKAGEKLKESEDDPLEYRTDGSDAFDTLLLGCSLFPYRTSFFMGSAFQG